MKTAIFLDVDGTLFDNANQIVQPSTIKAVQKLKENNDYVVALATGRSGNQLDAINVIKDLFDIKILINGAVAFYHDKLIFSEPLTIEECEAVLKFANRINVGIGFIGETNYRISLYNKAVQDSLDDYQMAVPVIDPTFYLTEPIYQLWVFSTSDATVGRFKQEFPNLKIFPWHALGADIVSKKVSKGNTIQSIKSILGVDRVIAFGDGENDIEMIQVADIGVVMGNSRSETLKKNATFVTSRVDEDGLYEACVKLNLF